MTGSVFSCNDILPCRYLFLFNLFLAHLIKRVELFVLSRVCCVCHCRPSSNSWYSF